MLHAALDGLAQQFKQAGFTQLLAPPVVGGVELFQEGSHGLGLLLWAGMSLA